MSWNIAGLAPIDQVLASARLGPGQPVPPRSGFSQELRVEQAGGTGVAELPATPPREAREMLDAAQRVIRRLHEQGRELHFEVSDGDLRIEVRDLDGRVLSRIPPGKALDMLSGEASAGGLP